MKILAEHEVRPASGPSRRQLHYSQVAVAVVGRAAEILSSYSKSNRAVVQSQAEMAIVAVAVAVQFVAGVVEASLSAVSIAPTFEFVDS